MILYFFQIAKYRDCLQREVLISDWQVRQRSWPVRFHLSGLWLLGCSFETGMRSQCCSLASYSDASLQLIVQHRMLLKVPNLCKRNLFLFPRVKIYYAYGIVIHNSGKTKMKEDNGHQIRLQRTKLVRQILISTLLLHTLIKLNLTDLIGTNSRQSYCPMSLFSSLEMSSACTASQ